jgi:hypothetical protein
MRAGESNCIRDYKRLGEIAKLATTYVQHYLGGQGPNATATPSTLRRTGGRYESCHPQVPASPAGQPVADCRWVRLSKATSAEVTRVEGMTQAPGASQGPENASSPRTGVPSSALAAQGRRQPPVRFGPRHTHGVVFQRARSHGSIVPRSRQLMDDRERTRLGSGDFSQTGY